MVLSSELLASILEEVRRCSGQGKAADYIPALAQVPADRLRIAVCTVEGELFTAGDAFGALSPSRASPRLLSLGSLGLPLSGGGDLGPGGQGSPSGQLQPNSLVQPGSSEHGIPLQPLHQCHALVVSDLLETRLTAPRQRTLELVRRLWQSGHHGGPGGGSLRISARRPQRRHRLPDEGLWQLRERGGQGAAELLSMPARSA